MRQTLQSMSRSTEDSMPNSKTGRGPYQNGIRTRREIIDSATRVFGSYGYAGGSLRQIADEVGVTPAALTRHFDNKEGLLAAVLGQWDAATDSLLPADVRGLDFFFRLRDTLVFNRQNRGLIELFLTLTAEASNNNHPARPFIQSRYQRVVAEAVGHLREARDAGETLPMTDAAVVGEVRAIYALMDGIQLQWLIDPDLDSAAIFAAALTDFLRKWTGREISLPLRSTESGNLSVASRSP